MEFTFRNVTQALPVLCREVLRQGAVIDSRAGGTLELRNVHITLTHPLEREVLASQRGAHYPAQIAETVWVLAGRNDVDWLKHYLPRAPLFSDDGSTWRAGYGPRLRAWGEENDLWSSPVDQVSEVVRLLRADADTRRAVMSIWDPSSDYGDSRDIPCNNWLHFLHRDGRLHLHVATRSNDLMWGWSGINAFEWSALLELVATCAGLTPGELHFSISSLHLYREYLPKAQRIFEAPTVVQTTGPALALPGDLGSWDIAAERWFTAERHIRESEAGGHAAVQQYQGPPLLKEWLRVLWDWHWSEISVDRGVPRFANGVGADALVCSPKLHPGKTAKERLHEDDQALTALCELHARKDAAYGDSWCKRGWLLSVLPNIARKVDRLEHDGDEDESALDTAADLLVYLAKLLDLNGNPVEGRGGTTGAEHVKRVNGAIATAWSDPNTPRANTAPMLVNALNEMLDAASGGQLSMAGAAQHARAALGPAVQLVKHRAWTAGNATRAWNPEA